MSTEPMTEAEQAAREVIWHRLDGHEWAKSNYDGVAREVVDELRPIIAAETLDEYADRMYLHSEEAALNDATEGSVTGIWAAANTLRKWASALRTTTSEHKGDPR